MLLVRKTRNLVALDGEARVDALATELADDATPDDLSVYTVASKADGLLVAALYNAGRPARGNPFDLVWIDEAALATLSITVTASDGESVFAWLRQRHAGLAGVTQPRDLAAAMAPSAERFAPGVVRDAIRRERDSPTVTTIAEWKAAPDWVRQL